MGDVGLLPLSFHTCTYQLFLRSVVGLNGQEFSASLILTSCPSLSYYEASSFTLKSLSQLHKPFIITPRSALPSLNIYHGDRTSLVWYSSSTTTTTHRQNICKSQKKSSRTGFEPARANPCDFVEIIRVTLLNHSDILTMSR